MRELVVFSLNGSKELGSEICNYLKTSLYPHEERYFHDHEAYCASLRNVRGRDVYVIQSCYTDEHETVNDKLIKLIVFVGSLRDASAARISVLFPYYPYSRQDRKSTSRAPVTTKYIARMLQSVGVDRVLTIDAHNPVAIQNAYNVNVDLLEANGLFANYITQEVRDDPKLRSNLVVMSPDAGGLTRARKFRSILERDIGEVVGIACMDKIHNNAEIRGNGIIGDVRNKFVIVLDDMISSGKTILECAESARSAGANAILAVCATHGLFVAKANNYLETPFIQRIVITDTIKPFRLTNMAIKEKMVILGTSDLFGEAIKRTHEGESISDLIEKNQLKVRRKQK